VILMIRGPLVGPSLRAYNTLLGFFAGSLYDEALPIPRPLIWHSLMVLALALGFLLPRRWLILAAVGIFASGHMLGFSVSRDDLHAVLSRTVATEHLILHFQKGGAVERRIAEIWPEAERAAAEIARSFGDDPRLVAEPTHVYLYDDADTKERLLGARQTLFTRPWKPELHVLYSGGEQVNALGHELVHAFARVWANGPLGVPARAWVLIDLGLTEGLAVALARDETIPPDLAMAALKKLGRLPDIRALFGTSGFYLDSAPRGYAAAGAFVTWLIHEKGIERVKRAYGEGSLGDISGEVAQYEKYLDTIALDDATVKALAEAFKERPLYARVCGREHAERKMEAARALEAQHFDEASAIYQRMREEDPGDSSIALLELDLAKRKAWAGKSDGGPYEAALTALLASAEVSDPQKQRLFEQLGDRLIARGGDATPWIDRALKGATRDDDIRRLTIKRSLMARNDAAEIFATLDGSLPEVRAIAVLSAAFHRSPQDGNINYLLARRLWNAGDLPRALPHLVAALGGELAEPVRMEALRFRLECFVRLRDHSALEPALAALEGAAESNAEILLAERARDKARFYLEHRAW
jgi:hypothetical protein